MSHAPYGDAEKGTLEITSTKATVNHDLTNEEKPAEIDVLPVKSLKKDAPVPTSKPPARLPKHEKIKASNYVLFIIWYNAYRRFFTVVFTLNFIGLSVAIADRWPYARQYPSALVLGNLNFAVLMRNEVFGRILYLFVNTCFAKWTPLWFRLGCTSTLQHLGGIHSSCAISGIAWFIFMVVNQYNARHLYSGPILGFGVFTVMLLFITLVAGLPWVRNTHHNVFERNHRFFGWSSLISTWIYTLLSNIYDVSDGRWDHTFVYVIRQQSFWYNMGMTTCTRKVQVDVELPSPKVAVLRFERGMQQGLLARISRTAIMEYHAFGIISEGRHAKYHCLICGVQGCDFTKSLVNDPPRMIWTREHKFAGVSNTSTLYKRGIRICTGTGLGAALSTCIQSPDWYLIWIGSDQEKTFGPTISGLIHRHVGPERLLLWDSKERGRRPDTMKILKEAYDYWQAEVVFITSNYVGNAEIQQGCKALGIPAFGTLWDFVSLAVFFSPSLP
ncbi:hypothetical protein EDD17DRAFT_1469696 [Pisolithus thermaeus]|nr:hypothetical protein EV401DRAFT_1868374 [Pisolithus croceorrhizus]KAI6167086.1 hypothetical protein EDD17DRAFT_1469696 [Pisolithus thermaeus]